MRTSNKSRNRNKNNNRRGSASNNINRVFESAGPEGRVRGTPQQIIDKYLSLTYDSQLSGDRVAAENFQQHAEHYSRLLIEAQKEIAEKQNEQNVNAVSAKGHVSPAEDLGVSSIKQSENGEKQEDKVVKLGNKLDSKLSDPDSEEDLMKSQEKSRARKGSKKRTSGHSQPIEV